MPKEYAWVVTTGQWEDSSVGGSFSTEHLARMFIASTGFPEQPGRVEGKKIYFYGYEGSGRWACIEKVIHV